MGRPREHGLGRSKTYYSWVEMKRRCLDKTRWEYQKYGARGIAVCERWMKFSDFLQDMGIKPAGTTLDRIDGKKGYFKENCRWSNAREQILNRSNTRWIEFNGERLCLKDWSRKTGLSNFGITWRLDNGWPIYEALTLPSSPVRRSRR